MIAPTITYGAKCTFTTNTDYYFTGFVNSLHNQTCHQGLCTRTDMTICAGLVQCNDDILVRHVPRLGGHQQVTSGCIVGDHDQHTRR